MLDPISDRGATQLYRIAQFIQLPEFVKAASVTAGADALPDTAFADPGRRQFPIHTKAATWMSYAYHATQDQSLDSARKKAILGNLDKAAADWGIELEIARMKQQFADSLPLEPGERFREKFALELDGAQYLPVTNVRDIMKSACELLAERGNLPWEARHAAAINILKAADDHSAGSFVPAGITKIAGIGCTTKAVLGPLFRRLRLHDDCKTACAFYNALPDGKVEYPDAVKLAGLLDGKDIGLFPEDELFAFDKKAQWELQNKLVELSDGSTYVVADMMKAAAAFKVLGEKTCTRLFGPSGEVSTMMVAHNTPDLTKSATRVLKLALHQIGCDPVVPDADVVVAIGLDRPIPQKAAHTAPVEQTGKAARDHEASRLAGELLAGKIKRAELVPVVKKAPTKDAVPAPVTPFMEATDASVDDDSSD